MEIMATLMACMAVAMVDMEATEAMVVMEDMVAMVAMVAVPMALTLHTVRVSSVVELTETNPSPYGYTVSLLLFLVPILVIGLWLVPQEQVKISKKAFWVTIGVLFPLGAALDFFLAHLFLTFPKPSATVGIRAPAIGGGVQFRHALFVFDY